MNLDSLKKLECNLPEDIFNKNLDRLSTSKEEVKIEIGKAGYESKKSQKAYYTFKTSILSGKTLVDAIDSRIKIRALSRALITSDFEQLSEFIEFNEEVYKKINLLKPRPSIGFINSLLSYYFNNYDRIKHRDTTAHWLSETLKQRNKLNDYDTLLFHKQGPIHLVQAIIRSTFAFDDCIKQTRLKDFLAASYTKVAKNLYYIEQLKRIPANEPNPLLKELEKPETYNSIDNLGKPLGQSILTIIIDRAPIKDVCESWKRLVLQIAGDPRISKRNPNYLKWWQHIDANHVQKVRMWLAAFDFELFLKALEDYGNNYGKADMQRMFPYRKEFLNGLLQKGIITNTRLFLTETTIQYLKMLYKAEDLPVYTHIFGDKSLIYIEMGNVQMLEGTHSWPLRIYRSLPDNLSVLHWPSVTKEDVTDSLKQYEHYKINHVSSHTFNWQNKAITALREFGIQLSAKDVLSQSNYGKYIRIYGLHKQNKKEIIEDLLTPKDVNNPKWNNWDNLE